MVISDGLWKRAFASAPETVGRTVTLNGYKFVVIGIMPAAFGARRPLALWTSGRRLRCTNSW